MKALVKIIMILFLCSGSIVASETTLKLNSLISNILDSKNKNSQVASKASENKILSQMIAKDVVLLIAKIKKKYYFKELLDSTKKFNDNLKYIKNSTLSAESQRDYNELEATWNEFTKNIKNLYKNGKINKKSYNFILNNNEKLLRLSHKLMLSIQSQNSLKLYDSKIREHTMNFADREKMLTQKMFKEKFLIFIKKDAKRNRVRLRGSYILFDNSLKALLDGDKKRGIVRISNKKVRAVIKNMHKEWVKTRKYYKKYNVTPKDMLEMIKDERKLYNAANDVVEVLKRNTELY